jgi:three-Cys-motif partner protein
MYKLDEIGPWSEIKLEIIKKYATAYSNVISKQRHKFYHFYIDGFCGGGAHLSKTTGEVVKGSPLISLEITPPFKEYHFVDLDTSKLEMLKSMLDGWDIKNVFTYRGDCNRILLEYIFPQVKYSDYRKGLCLLDPYGLHLNWEVIHTAGQMKSLEIFLNFPIMDMNRNVLWKNPGGGILPQNYARMNAFWGDESWRDAAYKPELTLFGDIDKKTDNEDIVEAFSERLKKIAGFEYVAEPLPMRNKNGATVYYLFFASQNKTGAHIISDIFKKYK